MASVASWEALLSLIADAAVAARVRLALTDPKAYVTKHSSGLRDRGVTAPIARLAFIALLDSLEEQERIALLDAKSAPEDVAGALTRVAAKRDWSSIATQDDDVATYALLRAAAARLAPEQVLLNLDTTSDQYALFVADAADAQEFCMAMEKIGHRAEIMKPRPLAKPRKKAAPSAGTPMASWPSSRSDAPNTWRYFVNRGTERSICTVKWQRAFDIHSGSSWTTSSVSEKRAFDAEAECTDAYVAFIDALEGEGGWLQLTDAEHSKELLANRAARKKGK